MSKQRTRRALGVGVLALAPVVAPVLTAGAAQAHGYTQR